MFGCRDRVLQSGRCEAHQRSIKELGTRPTYHQLYASSVWKNLRRNHLAQSPICVKCEKEGRATIANVVDHATPHKGDVKLFMDANNLKSLCLSCHSVKTAFEAQCRKTKQNPRSFYD